MYTFSNDHIASSGGRGALWICVGMDKRFRNLYGSPGQRQQWRVHDLSQPLPRPGSRRILSVKRNPLPSPFFPAPLLSLCRFCGFASHYNSPLSLSRPMTSPWTLKDALCVALHQTVTTEPSLSPFRVVSACGVSAATGEGLTELFAKVIIMVWPVYLWCVFAPLGWPCLCFRAVSLFHPVCSTAVICNGMYVHVCACSYRQCLRSTDSRTYQILPGVYWNGLYINASVEARVLWGRQEDVSHSHSS